MTNDLGNNCFLVDVHIYTWLDRYNMWFCHHEYRNDASERTLRILPGTYCVHAHMSCNSVAQGWLGSTWHQRKTYTDSTPFGYPTCILKDITPRYVRHGMIPGTSFQVKTFLYLLFFSFFFQLVASVVHMRSDRYYVQYVRGSLSWVASGIARFSRRK